MITKNDLLEDPDRNIAGDLDVCQWIPHTWQGEGNNVGQPVSMLRFSVCNLLCPWCDSDKMMKAGPGDIVLSLNDIAAAVDSTGTLMFTGGEPLTVKKNRQRMLWLSHGVEMQLLFQVPHITVETNGVKASKEVFDDLRVLSYYCDQLTVVWSPKFLEYMPEELRWQAPQDFLAGLMELYENQEGFDFCIKPVAPLEEQELVLFGEILSDPSFESTEVDIASKIYLMPLGETQEQLLQSTPTTLKQCEKLGVNFGPRVHISHNFD